MRFEEIGPVPPIRVRLMHSRKAYLKALRRFGAGADEVAEMLGWAEATTSTFTVEGVGLCHIVYMRPDLERSAAEDAGLIAHEATHVMQEYMAGIGEREPSDEFEAYVTQAVTTRLVGEHYRWKQRQIDKRDGRGR